MSIAKGFTLVELIVVMIVVAIVGVSSAAKISAMLGYDQTSAADEFYARLRLVQELNMNRDDDSCIVAILSNSGIWHQDIDQCKILDSSSVKLNIINFDNTVTIDSNTNRKVIISFDKLGRPIYCSKVKNNDASISIVRDTITKCSFTVGENNIAFNVNSEGYISYGTY